MSDQLRTGVAKADIIRSADEHDVEYFAGWAISGLGTLATILLVWHLGV